MTEYYPSKIETNFRPKFDETMKSNARVYIDPAGNLVTQKAKINAQSSNLMLYEAVVDAAGNGDYIDIQSALNDGKKRIFVRAGEYNITDTITITSDDVIIIGEDKSSVVLTSQADDTIIMQLGDAANTVDNVTIQNLYFNGGAHTGETGILLYDCFDITIFNCKFGGVSNGIKGTYNVSTAYHIIINNCRFADHGSNGIYITGISGNVYDFYVQQNRFYVTGGASMIGVRTLVGKENLISGNIFRGLQYGVYIGSGGDHNMVSNNIIHTIGYQGVYVNSDYNNISNNQIHTVDREAITIEGKNYNVICGNVIQNTSQDINNTYSAIKLGFVGGSGADRNIITNNLIREAGDNKAKYGIEEASGSDYNVITSNQVVGAVTQNILVQGANTEVAHNIE